MIAEVGPRPPLIAEVSPFKPPKPPGEDDKTRRA
jgi:hypothetical protein